MNTYKHEMNNCFSNICNIGGMLEIIQYLDDYGINHKYDDKTALIIASIIGHTDVIKLLISRGADLDITTKVGSTALSFASNLLHSDIVELLINAGANPNIQDEDGKTALMKSILYVDYKVIKLLLNSDLNIKNKEGDTALIMLCNDLFMEDSLVVLFQQNGADFFFENNHGSSAYSILKARNSCSSMLLSLFEKVSLEKLTDNDDTVYMGL